MKAIDDKQEAGNRVPKGESSLLLVELHCLLRLFRPTPYALLLLRRFDKNVVPVLADAGVKDPVLEEGEQAGAEPFVFVLLS